MGRHQVHLRSVGTMIRHASSVAFLIIAVINAWRASLLVLVVYHVRQAYLLT
ncbi:hypothetical protein B0H34DRAFT_710799 [Crassisporium funariophilum]|nr:hypothetical protein B0H34DRAFT_710799 [Crassisporium funariophilum]